MHISPYGVNAHYIAEGLAILFLKPLNDNGTDWKGEMRKAFREGNAMQVLQEAERLGFWCGSQRDKDGYMTKLISEII